MSEDISTPIPDQPGQDPDSAEDVPFTDGYGFSNSPDSGYDLGDERPAEPSDVETEAPGS